jgi:hypothetical protein
MLSSVPALAAEVPPTAFYSGNDAYDGCRNDRLPAIMFPDALKKAWPCPKR